MKVFIIQHYSPNKGDSAVLYSMVSSLRDKFNHIEISVSSYDPQETVKQYQFKAVPWIIDFKEIKSKKVLSFLREGLYGIYNVFWVLLRNKNIKMPILDKKKEETIKEYLSSDIVVVPGGHFFTSLNRLPSVLCHVVALLFAQLLNKPTMIYSHTIGPFDGKSGLLKKILCRYVLQRTKVITVREKKSLKVLDDMGITKPEIHLTAESVFLMPKPDPLIAENILIKAGISETPKVGITIHHIYYKYYYSQNEYIELMAQLADIVYEKTSAKVVFIPMEMKYDHGGDRPMAKGIIEKMKHADNAVLLEDEYSPSETLGIVDQMDLLIGTKTHSIVFSLLSKTPTLSLSYHPKSTEFMGQLGVEEYAVPLGDVNPDNFSDLLSALWEERIEIKKRIGANLVKIKEVAKINNHLLTGLSK